MGRRLGVYRAVAVAVIVVAALFAFSGSAFAADNTGCLTCHAAAMSMPVPDVDRDTACEACHVGGLVGTHPYHQAGSNCGSACHPGWGDSLMTAVPSYTDPVSGASFASATSKATSPAVLHIIHSDARWPQNVDASFSACSSCHAPAACSACHTGAVSANHTDHSATGNANYPAQAPWTGMVGRGVVGGDQTQHTAGVETNQCASAGCHDIEGTKQNRPDDVEDYNYAVGQNPDDPTGSSSAITLVGSWRYKASSVYTGSRMSYNNVAGSQLTATFTGRRVELVSDKDPYRGRADVYIDGAKVATIDGYSASTVYQAVLYSSDTLASGSHTISLRPLNTKNASARAAYVVADSFRVYADVPDSIAPECLSCHADKSSGHGGSFSHEATHTVGTEAGFACTSCHSLSMFTEHGRASSKTAAASCNACHTTYAPFTLNAYDFTCGGTAATLDGAAQPCHNNVGEQKHDFVDSDHDASAVAGGTDCKGCHGTDLSVIHTEGGARPYNAALAANAYSVSCLSCHGTATFPTTKDCTSSLCHNASFGGAAVTMNNHTPVPHPGTNNGQTDVTSTGSLTCSTCHNLELVGEHAKTTSLTSPGNATIACSSCHSAAYFPTNWLDTPGTTNTCTSCHPTAGGEAGMPHEAADYSAKHNLSAVGTNSASCAGADCHNLTVVDTLHASTLPGAGSCTSCHGTPDGANPNRGNPPTVKACATCHTTGHNLGLHTSSSTQCTACHTDKIDTDSGHASCATCHSNAILTNSGARYLSGTFTSACTSCHTAGVLGTVYDPTDPNHYDPKLAQHTANIAADTVATGGSVITTKACSACHATTLKAEHAITLSAGAVNCIDCHTNTTLGSSTVVANNWPNDKCSDCHGATHGGSGMAIHNMSASAGALGCSDAGCHTGAADVAALHADTVKTGDPTTTSCNLCHASADTSLAAVTGCDSCHAGHDMTVHQVTTDTGNCARCHGNDGAPANDVRGIHATCATCHTPGAVPGGLVGKGSNCVNCHTAGVLPEPHNNPNGNYSPYDANHYNGTESTHTVSAAQGNTLYDGFACSACHQTEMKPEHFKASSAFANVPGTYADKCVSCHEVEVDAFAGAWGDTCTACHATNHADRGTKHDVTASSCTEATGCHDNDVSVIHANSIPANAMTPDCASCHTNNTTVPTELDCGAVGCHAGMSAHGHTLASSTYNNTTVTGCTDSGAGCHGVAPANYQETHPASGCTSGACHTAANHNLAQFNDPNTCMNCHGGGAALYDGAPDVVGLLDTGTTGHYNETTHTATGMGSIVRGTTNGTASATCTDCHNGVSAGPDGFYAQHQGVRTGSLTCSDCHNKNAAIQGIVTDATRTDTCAACHNGTIVETQHATGNAPAVPATSALSCGATGTNCHTTYDLHELHKDAASCALSGCHNTATQGIKPTTKTCGQVGGCHASYTANSHAHAADAAKHQPTTLTQANSTTFASTACGACHDIRNSNSSLTLEHTLSTSAKTTDATNVCRNCHNNAASTTAITGNWATKDTTSACSTCHTAALAIHADSNPTAHSDVTSAGCSSSGIGCHPTADLSQVGTPSTTGNIHSTCLRCHDRTATAPNLAYNPANDTCGSGRECHATAGQYNTTTFVHNGASGAGLADGDDATHHTATGMTATITLGTASSACSTCHTATLKTAHATTSVGAVSCSTGGTGNTGCHNQALPVNAAAQVKGNWTNDTCADCHTATYHNTYTSDHTATSALSCGATGTNCHTTYDLRVLHQNRADGCNLSGCHDATNKDDRPTIKTCGQVGGCHASYTANSHAHAADAAKHQPTTLTQANATTFASTACGACHDIRNSNSSLTLEHTLSTSAKTTDATNVCRNCHNNAASTTAITGNWATKDTTSACSTCHTAALAIHADSNPTAHSDVTSAGCSSSGTGCHNGSDLSAVGAVTTVNSNIHSTCLRCHDRTATAPNLAYNPANDTCGSGRECHATAGQYNTTTLVHNGGGGAADGTDAAHHTAGTTQMNATYTYNSKTTACSACHSGVLGTEHGRSTSSLSGAGTTACEKCHNDSATVSGIVKGSWANKNSTTGCSDCHANTDGTSAASAHGNVATHSSGTSVTGCTGLGAGCHGVAATPDLTTVHTTGCALTRACHSVTTYNAGVKTCTNAACHPSANYNTTTYAHNAVNGTDATHTVTPASMTLTVGAGGTTTAACSTCHSSTLKPAHNFAAGYATASLSWTNECTGCHNATTPINVAALVTAGNWTDSCTGNGCHTTTQKVHVDGGAADAPAVTGTTSVTPACNTGGCHATMELHELHKNSAAGCGGTDENGAGCHNAANLDKAPTQTSCGGAAVANGACHATYASGTHGVSNGGKTCYDCHSEYQTSMEDGTGTKTGATRANSVHHVLGGALGDGDIAPNTGTYPTSTTDVYCVSCHTDHNYFNASKGANLRPDITNNNGSVTPQSTDFNSSLASYGICVSCHSVARAKQGMGTDQLNVGGANTPVIAGATFNTSAHNYNVASSFGASTFNANCSKCHSDEQTKKYATSTNKFGTHWSAGAGILGALGVDLSGDAYAEEDECYSCHSLAADGYKAANNFDWYGGQAMNATSQNIFDLMADTPATSQTSTNQLYFRPTADGAPAEPMPNAHNTGDTFQGGTWIGRLMAPGASATAYETKSQATNAIGTLRWRMVTFTSPPVATGVTVPAGSWTLNINARESNTAQNGYIRYMVYKWNAADTAGTTIVAAGTYGTELGTTAAPGTAYAIPLTGSAVTLAAGDKLSVCVEFESRQTVTTSYTGSFYWGSGAAGNLQMPSAVNFTWNSPATSPASRHNVAGYSGIHKPSVTDETLAYISANKHVECADCHGVHAATTGRHAQGATTLSGALSGASGATATFSGTNWTNPTAYALTSAPTKEYQICFKCHSGANTNVTTWGGTGAAAWTNQGLEFSTANQSYHPVVAGLPATDPGANGSSRLQAADMRAAGTVNGQSVGGWTNGAVMYCSDCHAQSSAGSLGPHGSSVKWMLKGPNQAWPYATAAANGTAATTGWRQYTTRDTDLDTSNGLFCRNCHVLSSTEHTRNDHDIPCVGCHIRVPHGGKVSRLIAATGSTTYPGNLPTRYTATGTGSPYTAGMFVVRFNKQTGGSYATGDCGFQGCTGDHPTANGTETW